MNRYLDLFRNMHDTADAARGAFQYGANYTTMRDMAREYDANLRQITRLEGLLSDLLSPNQRRAQEAASTLTASGVITVPSGGSDEAAAPSASQVRLAIGDIRDRNEEVLSDLVRFPGGADLALSRWPSQYGNIVEVADKFQRVTGGGGGGGGGGAAYMPSYSFDVAPNGDVYRMGSDGTFQLVDNFPAFAQRNVQVVTDTRTGEAFAIATDNEGNLVGRESLGQYAFPEIDPERVFRRDNLFRAAELEVALGGLELQRRGMMIDAIGNDMAMQIQLGRMTYDEVNLRLNTISEALNQRRAERQDILRFGVTRESLRTLPSGETVTRLPFAEQTAALLGQATGQEFSATDFELGVTYVNPEQAATDVQNAGQFTSPIPGLTNSLAGARQAISRMFSEPVGDMAVTEQALRAALQGV